MPLPPPALVPFRGGLASLWVRHMHVSIDFDVGKFAVKQRGKLDALMRTFLVPFSFSIIILLRLTSL